jgi:hypothetical protein
MILFLSLYEIIQRILRPSHFCLQISNCSKIILVNCEHLYWFKLEFFVQLKAGQIFNIEANKKALRNVNVLALSLNIEVNPHPNDENNAGIVVKVKLKALEQKTAEVSTEWSIMYGNNRRPTLVMSFIRIH